jgi:hypothetical protein
MRATLRVALSVVWRFVVETVTVAASRGFALSGLQLLAVSTIVLAVVAFAVVTRVKHFRNRNARGA